MFNRKICALILAAVCTATTALPGLAMPIDPALTIFVEVIGDDVYTEAGSADLTTIIGGTAATIPFLDPWGSTVNDGTLTMIGDGTAHSGSYASTTPGEVDRLLGVDHTMTIDNSSTDSFLLTFEVAFANAANAFGATSEDSYSWVFLNVLDPSGQVFFSDLQSDMFYGDQVNGTDPGTLGGALSDSGSVSFDVLIDGMESGVLIESFLTIEGGNFGSGEFSGSSEFSITLANVQNCGSTGFGCSTVPEPGTLLLFGLGLVGLGSKQRKVHVS